VRIMNIAAVPAALWYWIGGVIEALRVTPQEQVRDIMRSNFSCGLLRSD